jgi:hypothetical protein
MADKKARDIMSPDGTCVGEKETVLDAARELKELDEDRTGDLVEAISSAA